MDLLVCILPNNKFRLIDSLFVLRHSRIVMRVTDSTNSTVRRSERVLAYLIASSIGLSILAFLAVLLAPVFGLRDYDHGLWPLIITLPLFGLPVGVVLIITLLVLSGIRRSRETRNSNE